MTDKKKYNPYVQYRRPADGYPWFVNVIVTTRCNLRCQMCRSYESNKDLSDKKKVFRFFDALGKWLPTPRMVILTGGEPLLHPDIFDYIRKLADLGFIPALNSNGVLLNVETVDKLVDAGLGIINVSLDGDETMHDEQRNGPGLYKGVTDSLHYLSNHTDLIIGVVTVVSAKSAKGLPRLVRQLEKNKRLGGIQFQAIIPTMARPWDPEFFKKSSLWPRTEKERALMQKVLDELETMRTKGYNINNPPSQIDHWRKYFDDPTSINTDNPCEVAQNNLLVTADGAVQFCNLFGQIGTIEDDPKVLWESEEAQTMRQEMRHCKEACNFFVNCCYIDDNSAGCSSVKTPKDQS